MKLEVIADAVGMRALHGVARLALQVQSPPAARETVNRFAAWLPPFAGAAEARAAGEGLRARGTCLSRSLAVAARLHGSQVVIGVDPRRSSRLLAHAWVEMAGQVVYPQEREGEAAIAAIATL